ELGKGRSQKKAEASSTTKVYLDFLKRIHKACAKRGRRMQFWGDIILHQPELIKELPKDCIALNWGYGAEHPYNKECRAFATAGIEFYVCPGTSTWNSITGRTDNCLTNLENAAKNGLKYGATGYLNTDWGDGGHHHTLPMSYVGYTAGAGYSWNLKSNRKVDLADVISRHWFGDHSGMLGTFCLEVGRVANYMPKHTQPNGAVYNHLLFHELSVEGVEAQKFTVPQLRRALKRLDELEASLARSTPTCTDRPLILGELTHTVATARHALHRALFIKKAGSSKAELRAELHHLIRSHEDQWLARNRRGGLHESSTRLRGAGEGLGE
ncbi:MAG: glycoside hydrolase, partial [Planctomycetota bacterium]